MTTAARPRATRKTANLPPRTSEPTETDQDAPRQDRHTLIAQTAFFIAESRGFVPGQEFDDWLAAERMVKELQDSGVP